MKQMREYDTNISDIIATYNNIVRVIDNEAHQQADDEERAYGGVLRSVKGKLQEYITHSLVKVAWLELGGDERRIEINSNKFKIPLNQNGGYLEKLNPKIKEYILSDIQSYYYGLSVDKQIFIDDKFVMGIECKAYTENAMIKRILVDFHLLNYMQRNKHLPIISCYLLQLESQLGGDYSYLNDIVYGSCSTHTIMSYFNVDINIITLLEGERQIDNPIHKSFKELTFDSLEKAKNILKQDLKQYL